MSYQSVNPATGKVLKKFKQITNQQLETALKTAATCFETWRHKTFAERAIIVTKAAALMRERADEFAKPVTLAQIKADKILKELVMAKQSRLSVSPVTKAQFERMLKLAGS